jgi:GH24 family phage-related lysozyme (muramidase)
VCPAGKPTIGWGHTYGVKLGRTISEAEAEVLLDHDYQQAEDDVLELVTVPLTDNQLGALTSFVFNLGQGNFSKSTLLRKINASDFAGAAAEFDKWVYATVNGVKTKLSGLVVRRKLERSLFEDIA